MSRSDPVAGNGPPEIERQSIEADIVCVGFGPAIAGFLSTLNRAWMENPVDPLFESKVAPGLPLQVLCYERADDIAAGVSGVVTAARGIRASFPDLNPADIAMTVPVKSERILYLLDPIGASRRHSPVSVSNDPSPFCVADTTGFTQPRKGQFGATCNPGGGMDRCETRSISPIT